MIFYILMKILYMAKTTIICKVISLQLIKINEKKYYVQTKKLFSHIMIYSLGLNLDISFI